MIVDNRFLSIACPSRHIYIRPVDEGPVSCNANEVLMLRAKIKTLEERAVIENKSVLEAEKERDNLDKEPEFVGVHLQGKRV